MAEMFEAQCFYPQISQISEAKNIELFIMFDLHETPIEHCHSRGFILSHFDFPKL